jgi:hypothetical protein
MNDHVSLREFIERIIAEHERRNDLTNASLAKALELQAREYERRLEDLNHAHAEAQRVLGTYVAISVYEKDQAAFRELKERVSVELADRTGKSKSFPLVVSIASIVLSIFIAAAVYLRH